MQRSVCPYDCPDACGLIIEVRDGRAVKVSGDPDHPFTRGTLCPKMANYEKTVHSPNRLATPLMRTGPKGKGEFRPISWDEAIETIAAKWKKIIAEYGAEAILPCSYAGTMGLVQRNAGHPFFHRLGASRLDRTLCSPAKDYGWKALMGSTPGLHPDEVMNSDLVIIWGANAVATNIHFLHGVREAKKRGAKVWLVETYETPVASLADRVFVVRPGSDGALALGMMHVLVRDGLADMDFINNYVLGFEEFSGKILPDYTPEAASVICGLDSAQITEMARAYGQAKAPFIRLGSGLSRYGNGAMTIRTICCLPAIVGAWLKPGGGILSSVNTGSALPVDRVTREDLLPHPARIININQIGNALTELDPPIMSLYVYVSNPVAVLPDQNKVIKGLEREDLFTVVHERFMTDTARYADIVLPATSSLEHSDIYRAYGHYCIQRASAVIPPVGQSKSNWEVFCILARAMGFNDEIFSRTAEEMIERVLNSGSAWLDGIDKPALIQGRAIELPLPKDYKLRYKTPSGKIELLNPKESEPLPRYIEPHGGPEPFWFMSTPHVLCLNSSFNERSDLVARRGEATLMMNSADAAAKGLRHRQRVVAFNRQGEAPFVLEVTAKVPPGTVVSEGIWWLSDAKGARSVNALTSQKLTDEARGSTFYDTKVDVRPDNQCRKDHG